MTSPAVLVTGGAGGLGSRLVRDLAAAGFWPLAGCRSPQDATGLFEGLPGAPVALDLGDPLSIDAAIDSVVRSGRPLVGAILCAAAKPDPQPFGKIDADEMMFRFRQEITGHHRLLSGLVKQALRGRRQGVVVGVLSQAMGKPIAQAMAGMGSYTIIKHAFEGLLAQMAADYPWLTVDAVRPGFIDTPMLTAFDGRLVDDIRASGRMNSPGVISQQIVDLLRAHMPP